MSDRAWLGSLSSRRFRQRGGLAAGLLVGACSGLLAACLYGQHPTGWDKDGGGEPPDLAGGGPMGDMGTPPRDLAMPPDLSSASCRGSEAPGKVYSLATNRLQLPSSGMSYAFDIDGDGRAENQIKNIINVLSTAGLQIQTAIDDAVDAGQIVSLAQLKSGDPVNSTCVGALVGMAQPRGPGSPPRYDGTDSFVIEGKLAAGTGKLSAGRLETARPKDQLAAEELTLNLRLSFGPGLTITLPVRGAHLEGQLEMTGAVWRLRNGALHGAVSKQDIDGKLVPLIANQLTVLINGDPMSSTTQTIISLFESRTGAASVAKCMVAANCCRTSPSTCFILPAEVLDSAIGGILAPDVEVLDPAGKWQPSGGGKSYDALSIGLGFEAITATF